MARKKVSTQAIETINYLYNIKFIWRLNCLVDGPFDIKVVSDELNLSKDKALFLLNKKIKDFPRYKNGYRPEVITVDKV